MSKVGYGGSLKIATITVPVEEWIIEGQRTEVENTLLNAEDYGCLPGITKHMGSCTLQWDSVTKAMLAAYFLGTPRTRTHVAAEFIIDSTEKYTCNIVLGRYTHTQSKDAIVRIAQTFTVNGALTHA